MGRAAGPAVALAGLTALGLSAGGTAAAGQVPAGRVPAGRVPAGRVPAGQVPAGRAPAGQASYGHRMTPAMSVPLDYKYEGQVKGPGQTTFACQDPGAALECYTPQELATAYDVPARLTGAGQTIVIIDAFGYPTLPQDLQVFDTTFGLPAPVLKVIYPDGKPVFDPGNTDELSWSGEIALDVESAHAIAPGAHIDLVVARSDQDTDLASADDYVVRHNLGSVLSQSYGEAESCEDPAVRAAVHRSYQRARRKGITVFASSGDDGAALPSCDGTSWIQSVSAPASDPLVTGVGGTHLDATQPAGHYVSETAWNDEFGATGGGFSTIYQRPAYQRGLPVHGSRGVPDVSYSGDINGGLLIAWSQGQPAQVGQIFDFGGTSAGSPQWAAIIALADQSAHQRIGYLNPALYEIAATRLRSSAFHDVTTGNNTVTQSDASGNPVTVTGYSAATGWDPVTGLGSPDAAHLIKLLAG